MRLLSLLALLILAPSSFADDRDPKPLAVRVSDLERRVADLEARVAPATPLRSAAPIFADDLPLPTPQTFAAPVCVGGQCGSTRQSYSYQQSSGTGWYFGKRLGR